MSFIEKIKAFFTSYKGLISLLIFWEVLVVSFLSTFSGPMVERFGESLPWLFPLMDKDPARHADRTIMLYHALAIPFVVAVVFFILETYESRPKFEEQAKWSLFVGSMVVGIFGMDFAYFSESWISHGLFIFGQSIVFYGGVLFLIAVWPTKTFPEHTEHTVTIRGVDHEYFNLILNIIAILVSAIIGAIAGAAFGTVDPVTGNVWLPILAEEAVRDPNIVPYANAGGTYKEMVVSHLHIMLALLASGVMLLTMKHINMKGRWYKISNILFTPGVIIISIGAWLVITSWDKAHIVINVGSGFLLLTGGIIAVWGWIDTSKRMLAENYDNASAVDKVAAVFKDPARFALLFQLIWVDVVSAFPGVFVAINLEDGRDYRSIEMIEVEYSFNVGHWHVLATLIAIMMAMIAVDYFGLSGKLRQVIGWAMTIGSIIAFAFASKYVLRMAEDSYDLDYIMIDIGLLLVDVGILGLVFYIFIDDFKSKE
ncbi:MAG: hypothetical protein INQ03_22850 [Candidatus Heimdallarchaeota archaeon]|nr:hypothetical protein [Candidatus Heimdallarchaeota archaeon]